VDSLHPARLRPDGWFTALVGLLAFRLHFVLSAACWTGRTGETIASIHERNLAMAGFVIIWLGLCLVAGGVLGLRRLTVWLATREVEPKVKKRKPQPKLTAADFVKRQEEKLEERLSLIAASPLTADEKEYASEGAKAEFTFKLEEIFYGNNGRGTEQIR